jgi:hypothetical protein
MPTILPTHSCFDDALAIMVDLLAAGVPDAKFVHAIVAPYGKPFAHAWVEIGDVAMFKGIVDGKTVVVTRRVAAHYKALAVSESTHYSIDDAIAAEETAGHPAPWDDRYRELTRENGVDDGMSEL